MTLSILGFILGGYSLKNSGVFAMLLSSIYFGSGGNYVLSYEESQQGLQATCSELIGNHEAMGGLNYFNNVAAHPSAYLLNNLALPGP